MSKFKPMLASPVDWATCQWPKAISRKLDGIRCVVIEGVAYSRSLKPIPNAYIQSQIAHLHGYDGELIVGEANDPMVYRNSNSGVMSKDGEPDFRFHVFDKWDVDAPWSVRFQSILLSRPKVEVVEHVIVSREDKAREISEQFLAEGFEGAMLRCLQSPYKHGRATTKQGWLLKVKEWDSREMRVLNMVERQHNTNEATRNELGYIERSTAKAGKVGLGTMGTLIGQDLETGDPVEIGTGFTDEERDWFWETRPMGRVVKYRCMKYSGGYEKARMAVYEGLREEIDL